MFRIVRKSRFLLKILPLLLLFFIIDCKKEAELSEEKTEATAPVKITNPQSIDLIDYANFNGTVIFQRKETVRAPLQGYITKVFKNIGDELKYGDPIFQITTKESAANDSLSVNLSDKIFSGKVNVSAKSNSILTVLNHTAGDYVSEGDQLAVTADPHSLKIQLNVPFQFISKIRMSSLCDIILPDGALLKATIQKTIPSIDPVSQTKIYLLSLTKYMNLPENLNVNIRIPTNNIHDAIVVPKGAVMSNETLTDFWIMKALNDSIAIRVNITRGLENDSIIQIVEPKLDLKDKIIYDGAFGLSDTSKITIQN